MTKPKPPKTLEEKIQERYPDIHRKIGYGVVKNGYKVSDDPLVLIPDPEQLIFIEEAFDYLEAGHSLREVTEWLNQKLKKNLVHQTVNNLYKQHRRPWVRVKTEKKTRKSPDRYTKKILSENRKAAAAVRKAEKTKEEVAKKREEIRKSRLKQMPEEERPTDYNPTPYFAPEAPQQTRVLFQPNPGPQTEFLSAVEEEVLYGGAAGGEPKTWFSASFHSNVSK